MHTVDHPGCLVANVHVPVEVHHHHLRTWILELRSVESFTDLMSPVVREYPISLRDGLFAFNLTQLCAL